MNVNFNSGLTTFTLNDKITFHFNFFSQAATCFHSHLIFHRPVNACVRILTLLSVVT